MALSVFMWGVFAASAQVLLLREFSIAASESAVALGIFFSSWLFGAGAGSLFAGYLSRRPAAAPILVLAALGPAVSAAAVSALRNSGAVLHALPGTAPGAPESLLLALSCVIPAAAATGAYFPLASRLLEPSCGPSTGAGKVFWMEGAGMTAGAALAAVVLLPRVPALAALAALGALHASALVFPRAFAGWRRSAAIAVAAAMALSTLPAADLDRRLMEARFALFSGGFDRVAALDTPYARYDLGTREGEYALFINGRPAATFPDRYSSLPLAALALLEAGDPGRILVIGAASFGLADALSEGGRRPVDLVEIDPSLPGFLSSAAMNAGVRGAGVNTIIADGREYLRTVAPGRYGLIIVDAPDPDSVLLNRFFTTEFFHMLSKSISGDGVALITAGSAGGLVGAGGARMLSSIFKAFRPAFSSTAIAAGDRIVLMGANAQGVLTEDPETLASRAVAKGGTAYDPALVRPLLDRSQIDMLTGAIGSAPGAAPNTDMLPSAVTGGISLWGATSGAGAPGSAAGPAFWAWAIAAAGLLAIAAAALASRAGTAVYYVFVSISGAATICAEITAMAAYQSGRGAIYTSAAAIIASCMGGMSAGGFLGNRAWLGSRGKAAPLLLALSGLALATLPVILPAVAGAPGPIPLLAACSLAFACSLAASAAFPAAAQRLKAASPEPGRLAARLEFFECVSSGAAAIALAVLAFPFLGILWSAVAAGAMCLAGSALWAAFAGDHFSFGG